MVIESWPKSLEAWERAKGSLAGGVSTGMRASMKPHPLFFSHGIGSRMVDLDGHSYLDYVLGWGPVILGHAHPGLTAAVAGQITRGATFGAGHVLEYQTAERVLAAIPGSERVIWSNTGSEATQVALRLARAATGRRRFVKMLGHYHGWSDTFLVGYRPAADGRMDEVGSRGQRTTALNDVSLVQFGDIDAVRAILAEPDADIAAVFVEPILCNSGVIEPPDGYLAALRAVCDDTGTLLIFDEVITGFRIAYGGAVERFGVQPDLVVLAKAIAGGFPMSAVAGRADLLDQVVAGVVHAGTYNGNPVVLAATNATLEALRQDGVYDDLERRSQRLADGMRAAMTKRGLTGAVNQVGPTIQWSFGVGHIRSLDDFLLSDQTFYDRLLVHLLRRGVFALPGGRWYLSTAHDDADIGQTLAALDDALDAALVGGPAPVSLAHD